MFTSACKRCSEWLILLAVPAACLTGSAWAREDIELTEIQLTDTLDYTTFRTGNHPLDRYPPAHLFDTDLSTCWVCGTHGSGEDPSVFMRLPDAEHAVLNFFPGYGKSKALYRANARPRKVRLSLYAAINPDGYVTETVVLYKAAEFPQKKLVEVPDEYGIWSVPLDFDPETLSDFKEKVRQHYHANFNIPVAHTCWILKFEITETRPGTRYDDICVSEIFFHDRLISSGSLTSAQIEKVYLDPGENTLLVDHAYDRGVVVYHDPYSILQIIEVPENKKWAILISVPAEIQGRVETNYLLVDLLRKEVVNERLERYTDDYYSGNPLRFETGEDGTLYLVYMATDGSEQKTELQ